MIERKQIPPACYQGASMATKAVRAECLACMGGSASLVSGCPSHGCALWNHRLGGGAHKLAAIRLHCYECIGGDASTGAGSDEIDGCTAHDCHIYPLRLGRKPADWRERMAG